MRSLDLISRIVMLVLAGLVSLSIIGSIAAIPSGTIESRIGMAPGGRQPAPEAADQLPEPRPQPQAQQGVTSSEAGVTATAAPAPDRRGDPALWLEAITYALLALVGLAALAAMLLWRGVRERRRMADALELIAARWS